MSILFEGNKSENDSSWTKHISVFIPVGAEERVQTLSIELVPEVLFRFEKIHLRNILYFPDFIFFLCPGSLTCSFSYLSQMMHI